MKRRISFAPSWCQNWKINPGQRIRLKVKQQAARKRPITTGGYNAHWFEKKGTARIWCPHGRGNAGRLRKVINEDSKHRAVVPVITPAKLLSLPLVPPSLHALIKDRALVH